MPFPPIGDLPDPETEPVSCISCISCIGGWILYQWATWEAWTSGVAQASYSPSVGILTLKLKKGSQSLTGFPDSKMENQGALGTIFSDG